MIVYSFNPRPSSLTSELVCPVYLIDQWLFQSTPVITDERTPQVSQMTLAVAVSIHARHH